MDYSDLKVIAIGNSFSEDTLFHFPAVAKGMGVENVTVYNLYIGGCTLDRHLKNARGDLPAYQLQVNTGGGWQYTDGVSMKDALLREKWDFVSMQQMSSDAGMPDTFGALPELLGYVRGVVGDGPQFVWNMTWAYSHDFVGEEFERYSSDQMRMFSRIVSATKQEVQRFEDFAYVVPTGTAIQNARTSYLGDTLCRDTRHLSYDAGRYVAALTMFGELAGSVVDDEKYAPESFDETLRAVAIESANNALIHPFEVTTSQYAERP